MSKLGACTLIIEPHVFDITLYTVKGVSASFAPSLPQHTSSIVSNGGPQTGYGLPITPRPPSSVDNANTQWNSAPRVLQQATPSTPWHRPSSMSSEKPNPSVRIPSIDHNPFAQPLVESAKPLPAKPTTGTSVLSSSMAKPAITENSASGSPIAESTTGNSLVGQSETQTKGPMLGEMKTVPPLPPPAASSPQMVSQSNRQGLSQPSPTATNTQQSPALAAPSPVNVPSVNNDVVSSQNPVIQALAQRASADPRLKELMKIVALGTASETQLKEFQRHIDELNTMVKAKGNGQQVQQPKSSPISSVPPNSSRATYQSAWTPSHSTPVKQEPLSQYYSQPSPYIKSKAPVAPKPETTAIVFDIATGNGDRYLIPRKSILEYRDANREVVVSFFTITKGGEADGGNYKSGTQYYQLVTIKLKSNNPKTLELLRKVVDPAEVVRRYMEDIAMKMTVAEKAHLMMRLPRAEGDIQPVMESAADVEEDTPKLSYPAPNSLLPLRPFIMKAK